MGHVRSTAVTRKPQHLNRFPPEQSPHDLFMHTVNMDSEVSLVCRLTRTLHPLCLISPDIESPVVPIKVGPEGRRGPIRLGEWRGSALCKMFFFSFRFCKLGSISDTTLAQTGTNWGGLAQIGVEASAREGEGGNGYWGLLTGYPPILSHIMYQLNGFSKVNSLTNPSTYFDYSLFKRFNLTGLGVN